jgi:hypothetical protein
MIHIEMGERDNYICTMTDLTEEKQAEDIYKYFGLEPYWTATSNNPYRWGGTAQDF